MALPALIPVEDFFKPPTRAAATLSPDGTKLALLLANLRVAARARHRLSACAGRWVWRA